MKLWYGVLLSVGGMFFTTSCTNEPPTYPFAEFSLNRNDSLRQPHLKVADDSVRYYIDRYRLQERDTTLVDAYTDRYYAERKPYLWITRYGTDSRVDTLLNYLSKTADEGVPPHRVYPLRLSEALKRMRTLNYDREHNVNQTLATLEYYATKAYLRYVCGMRFGFINPKKLFNRLEQENPDDSVPGRFRTLYAVPTRQPDRALLDSLTDDLRNDRTAEALRSSRPSSREYELLKQQYLGSRAASERRLLAIAMERERWRTERPQGKYVRVNIADFSLEAVDTDNDTCLTMRVCVGSKQHKTPLLSSRINYLEINPVWTVPQSIIRREIAPRHAADAAYFERNRMTVTNRETGEKVNPASLTTEMLQSGNYRIQQAKGEGNSLGRLIFRFPNDFAIYLHDTPAKEAFSKGWRGLSHGCIRLERPLDLAIFLLDDKDDDFLIDRIRIAIDLPPLTEKGQQLLEKENRKDINGKRFTPPVPIYITYRTAICTPEGRIRFIWGDPYGYDAVLWKQIQQ